jgi:hypothetical protein
MQLLLKIWSIFILIVVIITGKELSTPLRDSTESVSKFINFKRGSKINFVTYYDNPYRIDLNIRKYNENQYFRLQYKLIVDGKIKIVNDKFNLGNNREMIGDFVANEGDICSFEILDIDKKLVGQKGFLNIDVIGGGPSVGIIWAKEFRYPIKVIFLFSIISFLLLVFLIYKKSKN